MPARIKTGVTWVDASLVRNGWHAGDAIVADRDLLYGASHFSLLETASTHEVLPERARASAWVAQTPPWLTLDVRAFATLSAEPTEPDRLPDDLREALPTAARGKHHLHPTDLGEELVGEIAARFRHGIEVLRASRRLGVVLIGYPAWFSWCRENERTVERLAELVPGCTLAVEFCNATWTSRSSAGRTFALLRGAGLAYVCSDAAWESPVRATSAAVAVVRFRGRGVERVRQTTTPPPAPFRYSLDQLREWVPRIRRLADEAATVHVLMSNGLADDAVANAHQMVGLLREAEGAPPPKPARSPPAHDFVGPLGPRRRPPSRPPMGA